MIKKIGLVIPIFNRVNYVEQCFDSLIKLTEKPDLIVLVNDRSNDRDTLDFISRDWQDSFGCETIVINNGVNSGVKYSLLKGIDFAFSQYCNIVINLDSDAIVKPNFIVRLETLFNDFHSKHIVSGFNCISDGNPILEKSTDGKWVKKNLCNGINMCFNEEQYKNKIKPNLQRESGNWDYDSSLSCKEKSIPFIVTTPSVVQHIGLVSSMGHGHEEKADVANDFYSLCLPDVTLFGIDTNNRDALERAAKISQKDINFGAVKIISDPLFKNGREGYSEFCIKKLNEHFDTSHVLVIQYDGYVVNWKAWDNEFLKYDYIGATWGYKDNMNVGNGGFSLRSKKLCKALAEDDTIDDFHPEDDKICRKYRRYLEKTYGIKFAPEEIANVFSIEAYGASLFPRGNQYSGQFGFHDMHVDFTGSDIPESIRLKK